MYIRTLYFCRLPPHNYSLSQLFTPMQIANDGGGGGGGGCCTKNICKAAKHTAVIPDTLIRGAA